MSTIALTLVGAGCAPAADTSVAIPSSQANSEALISPQNTDLRATANLKKAVEEDAAKREKDAEAAAKAEAPAPAAQSEAPAYQRPTSFPGILPAAEVEGKNVRIKTKKGDIVFEVLPKEGPKAASNFVALARSGFYDGLTFHRVEPGFVIQGGDPSGNGTGGPGYKFADDPVHLNYDAGIVAMANSGSDTNGSQFFIMLDDTPTLPKAYSIFGRVTSGMDVVRAIARGDRMDAVTVEAKK